MVAHLNFLHVMSPPIILLLLLFGGDSGAGWSDGNGRRNVISQCSNRSVSHSIVLTYGVPQRIQTQEGIDGDILHFEVASTPSPYA